MPELDNYTVESKKDFRLNFDPLSKEARTNYNSFSSAIDNAGKGMAAAIKITASEIGVFRSLLNFKLPNIKIPIPKFLRPKQKEYDAISGASDLLRNDRSNDYIFRVGNYYLPLTFTYTVNSSKNIASSQLVDGVEIFEQINLKPSTVTINIRVERDPYKLENNPRASMMDFIEADVENVVDTAQMADLKGEYSPTGLYAPLNSLYRGNSVFYLDNKVINDELGLFWFCLREYSLTSNAGSTVYDLTMTLQEVNMGENAIIFNGGSVDSSKSAGGGNK